MVSEMGHELQSQGAGSSNLPVVNFGQSTSCIGQNGAAFLTWVNWKIK